MNKQGKPLEDSINFSFKPNKIGGQINPKPPRSSTLANDRVQSKSSNWNNNIFKNELALEKIVLMPPPRTLFAPKSGHSTNQKSKESELKPTEVKVKKETIFNPDTMKKLLVPKQSIKKTYKSAFQENQQVKPLNQHKTASQTATELMFKQKAREIRELPKLEFDNTIELLADSCRKKATEKEKAYNKACKEVEQLKQLLEEEQKKLENYKKKEVMSDSLIQIGLIRYNTIKTKQVIIEFCFGI
ncbi:unnamed protein product [Rhizopus stolonifer]